MNQLRADGQPPAQRLASAWRRLLPSGGKVEIADPDLQVTHGREDSVAARRPNRPPRPTRPTRPTISTHVLDVESGVPAAGISVVLFRRGDGDEFEVLNEGETDADGRIADLIGGELTEGDYQLLFDLADYREDDAFLQGIAVALRVADAGRSYHVPLLLASYGATVYRGS
ncbi:MAG: hydroxyisourate hydrolase [Candidatus Limnocylindria bacterium]